MCAFVEVRQRVRQKQMSQSRQSWQNACNTRRTDCQRVNCLAVSEVKRECDNDNEMSRTSLVDRAEKEENSSRANETNGTTEKEWKEPWNTQNFLTIFRVFRFHLCSFISALTLLYVHGCIKLAMLSGVENWAAHITQSWAAYVIGNLLRKEILKKKKIWAVPRYF